MIEIINKINNTISKIRNNTEVVIDPQGNPIFLKDHILQGKVICGIIHKEDGSTLFLYVDAIKRKARDFYDYTKYYLMKNGFKEEIEWGENIPSLEKIDKTCFFREYSWVVINSGMKNKIAEKIFKTFWNEGKINFEAIKHPQKNKAIKKVYDRLDFNFEHLKQSNNKLKFLRSLPFIGEITQYHLARNLGLDYAKPDRHLVRIASLFGFNDVQIFCNDIAGLTGDKIGVVDLVLWRFATLFDNYSEMIKNFEEV